MALDANHFSMAFALFYESSTNEFTNRGLGLGPSQLQITFIFMLPSHVSHPGPSARGQGERDSIKIGLLDAVL